MSSKQILDYITSKSYRTNSPIEELKRVNEFQKQINVQDRYLSTQLHHIRECLVKRMMKQL